MKAYYTNAKFNFYMTTNPEDSIHLDWDDRRYFVWRIADVAIREMISKKWVDDFHRVLVESHEGLAALHYHLLEAVDCRGFDPNAEPPLTGAKQFAQIFSTNEAEDWVERFAAEQRERNREGVWVMERVRGRTSFPDKMFTAAFRRYFQLQAAERFRTVWTKRVHREGRNCRCGCSKPSAQDIKANRFVTLDQAAERYDHKKADGK